MKFIHTGDIHLGANPESKRDWDIKRSDEIWNTFERLIREVKNNPVDLLIISGDLFHRQPLLRELREVNYLFSTIPSTKVVLCAGNHDAIKKGSFYETFEWGENVIFLKGRNIEKVEIPELSLCVYGLSYYQSEIKDAMYDHIIIEDEDAINILVAHGGDDNHIPINKKKVEAQGFDYAALGHIHKPDLDERMRMAFCGSLEPIDSGDIGRRGYIKGEIDKGNLEIEFVPFSKRNYLEIEYTLEPESTNYEIKSAVKKLIEEKGSGNMYRLTLSGYRDADLEIAYDQLTELGYVVDIKDVTVPDYNFKEIARDNDNNILGMFINRYISRSDLTPREEKALYYGTKALLDATEERE